MATDEYIGRCVSRLLTLGLGKAPATPEDVALCRRGWADFLDDVPDDALRDALRAHVRDPERGRWWPTPADLLARVPRAETPTATPEQLWDRILERVRCQGPYRAQDGSGRVAFGDLLDAEQQAALRSIGGSRAIGAADSYELARLRAAWLRAVAGEPGTALRLVGGGRS